jgi:hypothetical protein
VKAFGLDHALAMQTESTLAAVLGGLLQHALQRASGSGEDKQLAIGEDAVYVEEEELDFAGAGLSGEFWHREDSSIAVRR